jgi:hypothetical protein
MEAIVSASRPAALPTRAAETPAGRHCSRGQAPGQGSTVGHRLGTSSPGNSRDAPSTGQLRREFECVSHVPEPGEGDWGLETEVGVPTRESTGGVTNPGYGR